jgi:hypothetical protein
MSAVPKWVLLPAAAAMHGFKNALACKRWCRAHGVRLRFDGAKLWVCPADIEAVVDAIETGPPPSNDSGTLANVEALKRAARC